MIESTHDPELVRRIISGPDMAPFTPDDVEKMAEIATLPMTQSGVVMLTNGDDALAAFEMTTDGIYQAHTLFSHTCRGRKAIETGREMVQWMFDHGASVVWGSTPRENRKARWFNRQIGAHILDTSDDEDEVFEINKSDYEGHA